MINGRKDDLGFSRTGSVNRASLDSRPAFFIRDVTPDRRCRPTGFELVNNGCLEYHADFSLRRGNLTMVGPDSQRNGPVSRAEPDAEEAARLMRAVAKKDRRAFEALYHAYAPRLGRYLIRLLKRSEVVDEVLNDVMLVVWQSAERYDPALSRLSTWLFGIAHNKALKALSSISRQQVEVAIDPIESDDVAEAFDDTDPAVRPDPHNPEQTLIGRQLGRALQRAVESLSPDHRAVIELAFAEDYSYQEIAASLDCPVNTVKTRMFYARKHLAELLGRHDRNTQTIARSNLS